MNYFLGCVILVCISTLVTIAYVAPLELAPQECADESGWVTKLNDVCIKPPSIMDY